MDAMVIRTNNVPRDVLYWHELTERERKEFDYLDTETKQTDATFFRYRGQVYDLGEFMRIALHAPDEFRKWDGYSSDSFFSGTLVRYVCDFERVVIATYLI